MSLNIKIPFDKRSIIAQLLQRIYGQINKNNRIFITDISTIKLHDSHRLHT
jgi:hypothetical protein